VDGERDGQRTPACKSLLTVAIHFGDRCHVHFAKFVPRLLCNRSSNDALNPPPTPPAPPQKGAGKDDSASATATVQQALKEKTLDPSLHPVYTAYSYFFDRAYSKFFYDVRNRGTVFEDPSLYISERCNNKPEGMDNAEAARES